MGVVRQQYGTTSTAGAVTIGSCPSRPRPTRISWTARVRRDLSPPPRAAAVSLPGVRSGQDAGLAQEHQAIPSPPSRVRRVRIRRAARDVGLADRDEPLTMTELNIWRCDNCGHIFNPREARYGFDRSAKGPQRCAECAEYHNSRAALLNLLMWH